MSAQVTKRFGTSSQANRTSPQTHLLIAAIALGIAICCSLAGAHAPAFAVTASGQDGSDLQAGKLLETQATKAHWETKNGAKYYILANGTKATGLKKIGSYYYFFSDSGKMLTSSLKCVQSGKTKYYYYFGKDGKAATGWTTVSGTKYYFASNGRATTGVKKIGSYTYVFSDAGKMQTGYKKVVSGSTTKYYYLNSAGRSVSGLKKIPNCDYSFYFNGDGTIAQNVVKKIGDNYYFFSSSGKMLTSSLKSVTSGSNKYTYYFGKDGKAATGWQTVSGTKYYFASNGRATTGVKKIGSYTYVFSDAGKMQTGYKKVVSGSTTKYYYLNSAGRSVSGFQKIPGNDYYFYFNGDGTIVTGFKKIDGYYYFFSDSGKMLTSVLKGVESGSTKYMYYFDANGRAVTSCWKTIDGNTYYFGSNGRAASGLQTIGQYTYFFSSAGKMQTGYKPLDDGSKYFFDENGRAVTGFHKAGDNDYIYYFNGDGTIKKSEFITEDGKLYFVTKDGKLSKDDWRNVGKADLGGEALYIHCDPNTGEVAQGMTTFTRSSDNTNNTYYFDKDAPAGYRTGMVDVAPGETYYFVETGNIGFLHKGFYTDVENRKVLYFDLQTGIQQTSGSVSIPDTTVTIDVKADGSLDIDAAAQPTPTDSIRTRLVRIALSQVFQPAGQTGYTTLMNAPLDSEISYNCSGFVMKVYKETLGQDLFAKDNDLVLYMDDLSANQADIKAGDIVFFNMEDCAEKEDPNDGKWIIDRYNNVTGEEGPDGKCDRIHEEIVVDDKRAHVHHLSIYLGNGQIIDAGAGLGVTMRPLSRVTNLDTFYIFCYGAIDALQVDMQ